MSGTTERNEKRDALLDAMGDVDESYIREYMEARLQTARRSGNALRHGQPGGGSGHRAFPDQSGP